MNVPSLSAQARPLIRLDLEAAAFSADWRHCDQVANYLARLASFDRTDTFLYSNLLSTVLNELLEIVFFHHQPDGHLFCTLLRDGPTDRIELQIPVDDSRRSFYQRGVSEAQSAQVGELYTRSLLGELPPDRTIGFLELASDYGAKIWLDGPLADPQVRLVIDVCLEEGRPNAMAS